MGIILNRSFKKKKTCRGLISSRLESKPLLGLGGGRNTRSTRALLNAAFPALLSQRLPREQEPSAVLLDGSLLPLPAGKTTFGDATLAAGGRGGHAPLEQT